MSFDSEHLRTFWMKGLAVATGAVLLLLAYFLASAPFAFVFEGQRVYIWSDDRITALAVISILGILLLSATWGRARFLRPAAALCGLFAGSVLFLFFIFNFGTNAPDGLLPSLFSTGAATQAMVVLNDMRFSPVYGLPLQAIAWFGATVASFFALRSGRGPTLALIEAGLFSSSILGLYSLGVYLVIPQWSARVITGLQYGTAVGWFSNDDLLACASAAFILLLAARLALRVRGKGGDLERVASRARAKTRPG